MGFHCLATAGEVDYRHFWLGECQEGEGGSVRLVALVIAVVVDRDVLSRRR